MRSKHDIQFHTEGARNNSHLAINVKTHRLPLSVDKVVERFGCSRDVAETALGYARESAIERFWDDVGEVIHEIFPELSAMKRDGYWQEGRSGGWLVLNIHWREVEGWDAIKVSAYFRLVDRVKGLMEYDGQDEEWLEDIEANRWAEEGAKLGNFFTVKRTDGMWVDGCHVDLAAALQKAREDYLNSLPGRATK